MLDSSLTSWLPQIATLALVVALAGACVAVRMLRGTTLLAAWAWGTAALVGLLCVRLLALPVDAPGHFVPAVLTVCPIIAVLGSKRPQHQAWQFIVLSALVVFLLPAAEGWVFGQGRMPELHVARQGLITAMLALGWMNYVATRLGVAATLYVVGQALLFAPHVAWFAAWNGPQARDAGAIAIAGAVVVGVTSEWWRRPLSQPLDAVWRPFRDQYGAAWSLRVAERFNATAREQRWSCELTWRGVQTTTVEPASVEPNPQAIAALDALLRRFVSREWLSARRSRAP